MVSATSKIAKGKAEKKIARLAEKSYSDASLEKYYDEEWKTFQMSDHLSLWIEVEIDFSDKYFDYLSSYNP